MKAYSYIRFSSLKQQEGGSLERQTQLSEAYCRKRGWTLDTSLHLQDLGVSAFRGSNVKEGALAGFLEACRLKRVPKGSVLIVESLDRLSRDQIRPALQLFLALQDFGITIVTLQPEREYPADSTDALALIEPLIIFARAHEESAMKSHRRGQAWKQARNVARQSGKPIMKTCPAWLETTADGFTIKTEPAQAVTQIYRWCLEGLGVYRITQKLEAGTHAPFGNSGRWSKAYVYRILTNPAAMGTYQPHRQEGKKVVPDGEPIPGHYPAIVDEQAWRQVQSILKRRAGGRGAGRVSSEANLFSKLVFCAATKTPMNLVHGLGRKNGMLPRKRYLYLAATKETGIPIRTRAIDYPTFERSTLAFIGHLVPQDLLADQPTDQARQKQITDLSGRLSDLDDKLAKAKERARKAKDFDVFLDLIESLQNDREQTAQELERLQSEDTHAKTPDLDEVQALIDRLMNPPTQEEVEELRRTLRQRIRAIVREIWVLTESQDKRRTTSPAQVQIYLHSGRRLDFTIQPVDSVGEFQPLAKGTDLRTLPVSQMRKTA